RADLRPRPERHQDAGDGRAHLLRGGRAAPPGHARAHRVRQRRPAESRQAGLPRADGGAGGSQAVSARADTARRPARLRVAGFSLSLLGRGQGEGPVVYAGSSLTAQALYSGILAEGSWAELVRKLAAEAWNFTKGTKTAPGLTAPVRWA